MVREALDSPNGAAADMQSTLHNNTASPGRRILVNESMRGRRVHRTSLLVSGADTSLTFENIRNRTDFNTLMLG